MNPVDETRQLTETDVHRIVDERIAEKGFATKAEIDAVRVQLRDGDQRAQGYTDIQIKDVETRTSSTLGNFRQTLVDVRANFDRTMSNADTTIKGWGAMLQTSSAQMLALQQHIERVDAKSNQNENNIDDITIRLQPLTTAVMGDGNNPSLWDAIRRAREDMQGSIENVNMTLSQQISDVNKRVDGLEVSMTSIHSIWARWDKYLSRFGTLVSGRSGAVLVGGVPPVLIWALDKMLKLLTG